MGQTVTAIMLGCKDGNGVDVFDEKYEDGMVYAYNNKAFPGYSTKFKLEVTNECDPVVLGFLVMAEHGDDNGVEDMQDRAIPFASVEKHKGYKKALKAWDKFAVWALKEGVTLPAPELWIVPTEVA